MVKTRRPRHTQDDAIDLAIADAMAAAPSRNLRQKMQRLQALPWRTFAIQSTLSLEDWVCRRMDRVRQSEKNKVSY